MASWMVHLRIADKLLDLIPGLSPVEFIVGNIAPDSGVPNADWSAFTPVLRDSYNERQYAFYLGYLTHLLTDVLWSDRIAMPSFEKFAPKGHPDRTALVWKVKDDWYDLDHKYLRDHPGFRAFRVYLGAVGFRNEFMEEFSEDAFDDRREYITDFYLQGGDNLDREYPYLTEAEMDAFVETAVREILDILHTNYGVKL